MLSDYHFTNHRLSTGSSSFPSLCSAVSVLTLQRQDCNQAAIIPLAWPEHERITSWFISSKFKVWCFVACTHSNLPRRMSCLLNIKKCYWYSVLWDKDPAKEPNMFLGSKASNNFFTGPAEGSRWRQSLPRGSARPLLLCERARARRPTRGRGGRWGGRGGRRRAWAGSPSVRFSLKDSR